MIVSAIRPDASSWIGCARPGLRALPSFPACTLRLDASIVAIGAFDGVHRGHQKVIGSAVASARKHGCPSVVYTFDTPPKAFFSGARVITPVDEKMRKIGGLGASCAVVATFDQDYAARSAEDFMAELARLNPREIWVGADFRFGARSAGDVTLLATRFAVKVVSAVCCSNGEVISSSRIRQLLGHDPAAAGLLLACD
jgi:riboflavin kinase/FMN adenylyltransferase